MKSLQRLRQTLATPPMPRASGPTPELYGYPVAKSGRYSTKRTKSPPGADPSIAPSWTRTLAAVAIGTATVVATVAATAFDDDAAIIRRDAPVTAVVEMAP